MNNCKKFTKWYRRSLWGGEAYGSPEVTRACLAYILRRLSRGIIPDSDIVIDALHGKEKVPECGYLGCKITYEHVH